ncbi:hypothetical protein D3C78_1655230 [compost metagenome]
MRCMLRISLQQLDQLHVVTMAGGGIGFPATKNALLSVCRTNVLLACRGIHNQIHPSNRSQHLMPAVIGGRISNDLA